MIIKDQHLFELIPLDFSANSDLSKLMNNLTVAQATKTLFQTVLNNQQIGYGGYLEKRDVYARSEHFFNANEQEYRCMHMGVDIWLEEGTELISPVDVRIHSFANNDNHLDYGHTIILECDDQSYCNYLLFGHLSADSIKGIKAGQAIKRGEAFAKIGSPSENGGWVPHLHMQCINDLQGYVGDFPGIALESELEEFQKNCPDPMGFVD